MWNVGIEFMLTTYGLCVVHTHYKKIDAARHEKKTFLIGKWCEEYS